MWHRSGGHLPLQRGRDQRATFSHGVVFRVVDIKSAPYHKCMKRDLVTSMNSHEHRVWLPSPAAHLAVQWTEQFGLGSEDCD